jgi:hypothetical protein
MNPEEVAQRIANSHALIQTKPQDRLDCINKTASIKAIILNCVAYLDQLHHNPDILKYTEDDLFRIHESVCVSAIPLLDMVEHFLGKAEAETERRHFAV